MSTHMDMFLDQEGLEVDEDFGEPQVARPITGLTNSQRRASLFRERLLVRLFERSSSDLSATLAGISAIESHVDETLSEVTKKAKHDGYLLDEQTTSDLLKIAGACSAMRQQMFIIAETISEFNQPKQGA